MTDPFLADPVRLYSPDGDIMEREWLMTVAQMNELREHSTFDDLASAHAAYVDQFMRTLINHENFDEKDAIEELSGGTRTGMGRARLARGIPCARCGPGPDGVTSLLMNSSVGLAMLLIMLTWNP